MSEINELIFQIESTDENIWKGALEKLSAIPGENTKRILMQIVTSSSDLGKKYYAKKILSKLSGDDVEAKPEPVIEKSTDKISNYLESDDYESIIKAIMHISSNNLTEYIPKLVSMLKPEAHPFVRATLVKAVASLGKGKYIDSILPFLKDSDNRVRANTVEAIEISGDKSVYKDLMPLLSDPDNRVKANAIKILKSVNKEKVINSVKNMLSSNEEYYVNSALFVIENLDLKELLNDLKLLVNDERGDIAEKASAVLNNFGVNVKSLREQESGEKVKKVKLTGMITRIIRDRGFVVKNNQNINIGVIYKKSSDLNVNANVGIIGKLIQNDGFYFIIPENISKLQSV